MAMRYGQVCLCYGHLIHRKRSPFSLGEGFGERSFVWATDGCAFFNLYILGSSRTSTPTIRKDDRRMYGGDPYDLGRPMVAPTNEIYVDAFGYRPNKDFYVALHNQNKKKHAVGCPSACFYIALY